MPGAQHGCPCTMAQQLKSACATARHLIQLEEEVSQHHLNYNRDVVGVTPTTRIGRMNAEVLSEVRGRVWQ